MRITKKIPIRQRGRTDNKRQATKDSIRDVYLNGPQKEVQIIPAKRDLIKESEKPKLRVCAYCRVSTEEDNQASSYELQVQNYTKMIQENDEWEFAGIFADEGISGTSTIHREQFLMMIEKCKAGEIDLIITKQVSRFARNVLDSLNYIFMLRKLDPPVGVYFEAEKLNTLDRNNDMVITVLSLVAQGLGIYPSWCLLGYTLDEHQNWIIVEDEAEVVRAIYSMYLEGFSSADIARFLTQNGVPTVKGKEERTAGSVLNILKNEKYCGDALCQKTVTLDFSTHKSVRNEGLEPQYFIEDHHPPIIDKRDWLTAQEIRKERRNRRKKRGQRKARTVVRGAFAGFSIVDPTWDMDLSSFLSQHDQTTEITSPLAEADENFTIEKE